MSHFKQFLSILAIIGLLCSCESANIKNPDHVTSVNNSHEIAVVDCMLPDQIKKISENIIYFSPSHPIQTLLSECYIRGGQKI